MDEPKKRAQISWGRDWRVQKAALVAKGKTMVDSAYTMFGGKNVSAACWPTLEMVKTHSRPSIAEDSAGCLSPNCTSGLAVLSG